jgi:hypothetical protein
MADLDKPTGEELIDRLQKGKLPQMVDWMDPAVLGMVAVRTLISTTIGEYADQRPMQEAVDGVRDPDKLILRHDYSRIDPNAPLKIIPPDGDHENLNYDPKSDPKRCLNLDKDGALWVDFVADLGDGFEATYAMAYLLAQSSLDVLDVQGTQQTTCGRDVDLRRRPRLPERDHGGVPQSMHQSLQLGVYGRPISGTSATGAFLHCGKP